MVLGFSAEFTPDEDQADATALAKSLGIRTYSIPLGKIVNRFLTTPLKEKNRLAICNVFARMRMVANYFVANSLNYLVVGTGDRSESLIGYFAKYGDGGSSDTSRYALVRRRPDHVRAIDAFFTRVSEAGKNRVGKKCLMSCCFCILSFIFLDAMAVLCVSAVRIQSNP